jgi:hypothetical protein
VRARPGAPNIVIVLMDDMGWADVGCYGSEIATPNIDALAARGIRFSHYTTRADHHRNPARGRIRDDRGRQVAQFDERRVAQSDLADLSRLRAALLTGRNAHSVATGWLANNNPGFPGYFGDIPLDVRPVLWISRRRDRVFLSGAHRLQQHRRPDRRVSAGLLRDRRLDGQGHRLCHRDPQPRPDPTVLSLRRQQCRARTAPSQGSGSGQISRPL